LKYQNTTRLETLQNIFLGQCRAKNDTLRCNFGGRAALIVGMQALN